MPIKKTSIVKGVWCLIGLLWVTWTVYAAWFTGPVISDSWQSVGSAVAASHPFDLSGLYLGDFDGFHRTWGHHWPGWPMLWSIAFCWLPFHSSLVFVMEALLHFTVSYGVYRVVAKESNRLWAFFAVCVVLLDSAMHISLSMMRPEIPTSLLFLLLVLTVKRSENHRKWLITVALLSAMLPLIHVMGCIAPPALLVVYFIQHRCSLREAWAGSERRVYLSVACGWAMGALLLSLWFILDSDRLHQFTQNLEAQRLSLNGWWNSFRMCYLGDFNGTAMLALWVLTAIFALRELFAEKGNQTIVLFACLPLAAVIFSIVAKNPNRLHLASVVPCAAIVVSLGMRSILPHIRRPDLLLCAGASLALVWLGLGFHGKRMWRFATKERLDMRSESQMLLSSFRSEKKVFLPMSLWEAAANEQMRNVAFYTFPNVATAGYRSAFEKSQWSTAEVGDVLLFDLTQEKGADQYFKPEAYVKLRSFDYQSLGSTFQTSIIRGSHGERRYQAIRITSLPAVTTSH